MHIVWAAKTLQLESSAGIAQSTSMIWQVPSMLPDIVKDLLKDEDYTNWAELAKVVMDLKGSRLVEKQEQADAGAQCFEDGFCMHLSMSTTNQSHRHTPESVQQNNHEHIKLSYNSINSQHICKGAHDSSTPEHTVYLYPPTQQYDNCTASCHNRGAESKRPTAGSLITTTSRHSSR
jgi:hypothetical protein